MKYEIKKTDIHDIYNLILHLRYADKVEVESASGQDYETCLLHSYLLCKDLEMHTMTIKGEVVCVYGVLPSMDNPDIGVVFLLGTDLVNDVKHTFLKASRKYIAELQKKYRLMYNYVHDENELSKKWLEWLGATIIEPKPFGAKKELFRYFEFRVGE